MKAEVVTQLSQSSVQESDPGLGDGVGLPERVELVDQEVEEVRQERERDEVSGRDREAAFEEVPRAFFSRDADQSVQRRGVAFLQLLGVGPVSVVAGLVSVGLLSRLRRG